jgi:hypothetical protein
LIEVVDRFGKCWVEAEAGISGKYSVMGRVESVRADDSTISVAREGGSVTMKIGSGTSIYLDKSKLKLPNAKGSWADIQPGRMVEVKYKDSKQGSSVEWRKVQLE